MDPEIARKKLAEIEKRNAKSGRGREYRGLLENRGKVEQACETAIRQTGLDYLLENHELIRKEDGTWIWINTIKKKPAPWSKVNEIMD